MKQHVYLLVSAVIAVIILCGCNPDVFVSEEMPRDTYVEVVQGRSVRVNVPTDGLESVRVETDRNVRIKAYFTNGDIFDYDVTTLDFSPSYLTRIRRMEFDSDSYSSSIDLDTEAHSFTFSALRNDSDRSIPLTVTLFYPHGHSTATFISLPSAITTTQSLTDD